MKLFITLCVCIHFKRWFVKPDWHCTSMSRVWSRHPALLQHTTTSSSVTVVTPPPAHDVGPDQSSSVIDHDRNADDHLAMLCHQRFRLFQIARVLWVLSGVLTARGEASGESRLTARSPSYSMARWSLRYLGPPSNRHCGPPLTCAASAAEFETFGSINQINQIGTNFVSALDHRILSNTDDLRESVFLFRSLSVPIKRFRPSIQSAPPIHSPLSILKCDVTSRDALSSWFLFLHNF